MPSSVPNANELVEPLHAAGRCNDELPRDDKAVKPSIGVEVCDKLLFCCLELMCGLDKEDVAPR
jgi:hypothetical protein